MTKRIVATDTRSKEDKIESIRHCLVKNPQGINPKSIARETGLNVNTVKTLLPQMSDVTKVMRGLYKIVNRGDGTSDYDPVLTSLHEWNFHNCILSANSTYPDVDMCKEFGVVKMIVSSANGKATCRLSTDYPLNVSSLAFVAGYFADLVGAKWLDVSVSSIEFNKDYRNLRLDGVNSISVGSLCEQFKLYQKRHGLRIEHKTAVPFTMDNIVSMLSQNPMSADTLVKLDTMADRLENLTRAVARQQRILLDFNS